MLKQLPLLIGALMAGEIFPPIPAELSLGQLGGKIENYAPIVDPRTDLDAKAGNTARLTAAQTSLTLPRAWLRFTAISILSAPSIAASKTVWGPAPVPAISRILPNAGHYLITFPSTVTIEGETVPLQLAFALVSHTRIDGLATAKLLSPTTVEVKFKLEGAGTTSDPGAGESITLMVR